MQLCSHYVFFFINCINFNFFFKFWCNKKSISFTVQRCHNSDILHCTAGDNMTTTKNQLNWTRKRKEKKSNQPMNAAAFQRHFYSLNIIFRAFFCFYKWFLTMYRAIIRNEWNQTTKNNWILNSCIIIPLPTHSHFFLINQLSINQSPISSFFFIPPIIIIIISYHFLSVCLCVCV